MVKIIIERLKDEGASKMEENAISVATNKKKPTELANGKRAT